MISFHRLVKAFGILLWAYFTQISGDTVPLDKKHINKILPSLETQGRSGHNGLLSLAGINSWRFSTIHNVKYSSFYFHIQYVPANCEGLGAAGESVFCNHIDQFAVRLSAVRIFLSKFLWAIHT
jgi:hypothetical protein